MQAAFSPRCRKRIRLHWIMQVGMTESESDQQTGGDQVSAGVAVIATRICAKAGCGRKLHHTNKSGFCDSHFHLLGNARKRGYLVEARADELGLYQADPLREEHLQQRASVVCRECGARRKSLHHHVSKMHKMALQEYLEKWNFPLTYAQEAREKASTRRKEWGTRHGGDHFCGQRHELRRGERRKGKPPTPAMQRHRRRLRERMAGKPQLRRRIADDASIVDLRLAGRTHAEIGAEVGLTGNAVCHRLRLLGFPGTLCRFLHGEPVAKKHFADLCNDFGTTMKSVARLASENADYEIKRKPGIYFGGKARYLPGKVPRTYYNSLSNCLSRHKPEDILPPRFADLVLDVRRRLTEAFCFATTGKRARHFVTSECRDLPGLRAQLLDALTPLRAWLRTQQVGVKPHDILNWICDQSRQEVLDSDSNNRRDFRTLMFLWPALRDVNEERQGFLASLRSLEEVVDELLAKDYSAAAFRIRCAGNRELRELDPRTLGQSIAAELAKRPHQQHKKRGRRPGRDKTTLARITLAAALLIENPRRKPYSMSQELYPKQNRKRPAFETTIKLFTRNASEIDAERRRLSAMSIADRSAEAESARRLLASS